MKAVLLLVCLFVCAWCAIASSPDPQDPHYHGGEHNEAFHGETPAEIISSNIEHHDVVIFSKSYCPFCRKTKALFDSLGVSYHALELDQHAKGSEIQQALLGTPSLSFISSDSIDNPETKHRAHRSEDCPQCLRQGYDPQRQAKRSPMSLSPGTHIGGSDSTVEAHKSGRLDKLLKN